MAGPPDAPVEHVLPVNPEVSAPSAVAEGTLQEQTSGGKVTSSLLRARVEEEGDQRADKGCGPFGAKGRDCRALGRSVCWVRGGLWAVGWCWVGAGELGKQKHLNLEG